MDFEIIISEIMIEQY